MPNSSAFETQNGDPGCSVVVLCDHASRHIPPDFSGDDLGLGLSDLERHIAYDVGALEVARLIRENFDATLVSSRFSRLLIDANRGEDDPTLVMHLYDGTIIPGNRLVDSAEIERRIERFHRPYQNEIRRVLDEKTGAGLLPVLLSIHSFTPQLRHRERRPWHIGILWEGDNHLARSLIGSFGQLSEVCVGDNQPYSGQLPGSTLHRHGTARGLPHVLIEFRNDLIENAEGQRAWTLKVLPSLRQAVTALTENHNGRPNPT